MPVSRKLLFLILFIHLAMDGCHSSQTVKQTDTSLSKVIEEKIGKSVDSFENNTKEYVLIVQKRIDSENNQALKFLVMRKEPSSVILEKTFIPGYVKWISAFSIELLDMPGTIETGKNLEDYIQIIEIKSPKH